MDFSSTGPSVSDQPGTVSSRARSSAQIRASGQAARSSSGATWRYSREISGERML